MCDFSSFLRDFAAQFAHKRYESAAWRNTVRIFNSFRFTDPPKKFTGRVGERFRVIQYQLDRALRAAASVSVFSRFWDQAGSLRESLAGLAKPCKARLAWLALV